MVFQTKSPIPLLFCTETLAISDVCIDFPLMCQTGGQGKSESMCSNAIFMESAQIKPLLIKRVSILKKSSVFESLRKPSETQ